MNSKFLLLSLAAAGTLIPSLQAQEAVKEKAEPTAEAVSPLEVGSTVDASVLPKVWLQGEPVSSFKKGVVYVIDFWGAPAKGPRVRKFANRAPAYNQRELMAELKDSDFVNFISICINGETDKKRLKRFMALPEYKSSHAIALDAFEGTVVSQWVKPAKISYIPYSLIVKDSTVLWHGESDLLPDALVRDAIKPDFTLADYQKGKEKQRELFKDYRAFRDKLVADTKAGANTESMIARLDAKAKDYEGQSYLMLQLVELKFSYYLKANKHEEALAVFETMIDSRPKDVNLQKRAYKYLQNTEALKPASNPVIIKCLANLAEITETGYATASWRVIGDMKKSANDIQGAIEAYQKAVDISDASKRLKIIQAGGTPPLAQ